MTEYVTVFVPGTIYWCKVLGAPVDNYDGDAKEWTFDFAPDDVDFLKENRLLDRLKEDKKGTIKGDYLHLRKPEKNYEGDKNPPIAVYTDDDEAWDTNVKIGNGTRVLVKLSIVHWGKGKKSSIWTKAIRVTDLVPYVTSEFGAYDGPTKAPKEKAKSEFDDDFVAEPKARKSKTKVSFEDLDDDVPF